MANTEWRVNGSTDSDSDVLMIVTERFERRLVEETGKLRVEMAGELGRFRAEMAGGFGALRSELAEGFGRLRAEMIDRSAELLNWGLIFAVTQTAAIAAIVSVLR
jgi:hypothetical protein